MQKDVTEVTEVVPENKPDSKSITNSSEVTNSSSVQTRTKNDSGYSSFISQKNFFIRTSSPIVAQVNNTKFDSPGTSYSSHNSAQINDEEMEGMFPNTMNFLPIEKNVEKTKESHFHFWRDLENSPEYMAIRHSVRNSPWTVRPDSVNEEDEDSEKEAQYSCSLPQESKLPTRLSASCRAHQSANRRYSLDIESELRKEIIATKLLEIADKINTTKKVRTRINSTSSDNVRLRSRRHSHSSFADIVPCGCGSAVDLILSLYNVYKQHSSAPHSSVVINSQSMANMATRPPKTNSRSRSHTE